MCCSLYSLLSRVHLVITFLYLYLLPLRLPLSPTLKTALLREYSDSTHTFPPLRQWTAPDSVHSQIHSHQLETQCGQHTSPNKYSILLIMQSESVLGFFVTKIHIFVGKIGTQFSARLWSHQFRFPSELCHFLAVWPWINRKPSGPLFYSGEISISLLVWNLNSNTPFGRDAVKMQWNKASRVTGTRQSLGYHEPLLLSSCYMAQKNMHWL